MIFQIDGEPVPIPLKPSEVRSEVRNVAYDAVTKCGTNVPLLRSLEAHINEWVGANIHNGDNTIGKFSLAQNRGATVGYPANSIGLKPPKVKGRLNGKRVKATYRCSVCKREGHTKAKCPEKKVVKDDDDDDDKDHEDEARRMHTDGSNNNGEKPRESEGSDDEGDNLKAYEGATRRGKKPRKQ
jgi:hypothetical protein